MLNVHSIKTFSKLEDKYCYTKRNINKTQIIHQRRNKIAKKTDRNLTLPLIKKANSSKDTVHLLKGFSN